MRNVSMLQQFVSSS